jgi:hypothetical protein
LLLLALIDVFPPRLTGPILPLQHALCAPAGQGGSMDPQDPAIAPCAAGGTGAALPATAVVAAVSDPPAAGAGQSRQ